ncbi:MAG: hypothetical protein KGJ66_00435 [Alphaproteobacteria bacterium]|nr:hypothetical protein [Alphaproteobacteria bacterium]
MPKVLISDELSPRAVAVFKQRGVETVVNTKLTPDELKKVIGEFDGLAVRSATKVTKPVIEAAKRLKVIGRAGIGVDNIDVAAATQRGIALEAELGPHMLFVRNHDKPGFIGNLGRTLGEVAVNIATFHLGRSAPGRDAICLVQVDQPLGDPLLAKVRGIANVVQAKELRF